MYRDGRKRPLNARRPPLLLDFESRRNHLARRSFLTSAFGIPTFLVYHFELEQFKMRRYYALLTCKRSYEMYSYIKWMKFAGIIFIQVQEEHGEITRSRER